jgi:hypothetical protein
MNHDFDRPNIVWWLLVLGSLTLLALLAFRAPVYAWWVARAFPLPPRPALVALFAVAVALHIGEATYAARLARRFKLPAGAWAVQTLLLGFPSLRLLLRRVR